MENKTIPILCTVGAGLDKLVTSELEPFAVGPIQNFPGKFIFNVLRSNLTNLLNLKLVERIFWLLLTTEWKTSEDPTSITTFVSESLSFSDTSNFTSNRTMWFPEAPESTIRARLFVKLRPKFLIRHTQAVYSVAVDRLSQLLTVEFCSTSCNSMNLMICNSRLFLGIPMSKTPLSKRAYLVHSGLRSTSAAALTRNIKGGLLLDPMCGRAITLCEAAARLCDRPIRTISPHAPFVFLIGTDCNADQLACARDNLVHLDANYQHGVIVFDLVCCTLECSPFRDGVFDKLVCDLPFGHKHGVRSFSVESFDEDVLKSFYQRWLMNMSRLLSFDGSFSLLVSERLSAVTMDHLTHLDMRVTERIDLPMGKTAAAVLTGRRVESNDQISTAD